MIKRLYQLKNRKVNIIGIENCFKSSVLLPLIDHNGQTCVLFEVRANQLRRQPGEICFPGGQVESTDSSPVQTAIRETSEELGLAPEDIEVIAPLDLLVTPCNTIIYPFLCRINNHTQIALNTDEVEEVFYVPLDYLYSTSPLIHKLSFQLNFANDFPFDLIPQGKNYNWREGTYPVYFYFYQKYIIWGMTARILHHFLFLTRDIRTINPNANPIQSF